MSQPWQNETTAPPAMAVDKSPDACVVYAPRPTTASEKMVANMIELHRPTAIIDQTATLPVVLTERAISPMATTAQTVNTRGYVWSGLGAQGQYCMTAPRYGTATGQRISVQACQSSQDAALYTAGDDARPSQVIAHVGNTLRVAGGCLTQSHNASGSAVLVEPCVNSVTQQWQAQTNGSVRNMTTHLCLNTYGGAPSTAAPTKSLVVYSCNGTPAQVFTLPDK